jgi:hypothetical protein
MDGVGTKPVRARFSPRPRQKRVILEAILHGSPNALNLIVWRRRRSSRPSRNNSAPGLHRSREDAYGN